MRIVVSALLMLILVACTPKVDNSDTETLASSLVAMSKELKESERLQLLDALLVIALSETGYLGEPPNDLSALARDSVLGPALLRTLDGENFADLLLRADGLREQKEQRTVAAAEKAKQDVLARIEQAKAETEHLSGVRVLAPAYGWSKGDYIPQAYVEFDIANNSGENITGVKMRGELLTDEQSSPWLHESLTHELIRPLADQNTAHYRLIPNQYSPWGNRKLQNRRDVRLTLAVINVRVGDTWQVSADPESLEKELHAYEKAAQDAGVKLAEIRARHATK